MIVCPIAKRCRGWIATQNAQPVDPDAFANWKRALRLPQESAEFSALDAFDVLNYLNDAVSSTGRQDMKAAG